MTMTITNENTFNTTYALSALILWVLFSSTFNLFNCDVKKQLTNGGIIPHIFALVAFFFLITVIDQHNDTSQINIFIKTFYVYILFVLLTKSKWYFVLISLSLLLFDQLVRNNDSKHKEQISKIINIILHIVIVSGTIHFMLYQKNKRKNNFNLYDFFFAATNCK